MLRRKDLIVIAAVLLAAALLYGGMMIARSRESLSGKVEIRVDGEVYATLPLNETRTFQIDQADGRRNVLEIGPRGVRMIESTCKNQLCLGQGEVTQDNWTRRALGRAIVCLPNRVLVELALSDGAEKVSDDDPPDV